MSLFDDDTPKPHPVDGVEAWMEHPAVQELLTRLDELTARLDAMTAAQGPLKARVDEAQGAYEAWLEEQRVQQARWMQSMRDGKQELNQLERDLFQLKNLRDNIKSNLRDTLAGLEAQTKINQAQEKIGRLLKEGDFKWEEAIRPFQMSCVEFATLGHLDGLGGVLIADQMGLGKTLEAAASIEMIQASWESEEVSDYAVLWVCPNSIKTTTLHELKKWTNRLCVKVEGNPEMRRVQAQIGFENGAITIANYETLSRTEGLLDLPWKLVVLDEAHKFKNDEAQVFENVEKLCEKAEFVIPMTGTPIMNKPTDFWAILHMLTLKGKYAGRFKDKWRFINEYCWQSGSFLTFRSPDFLLKHVGDMVIRRRKDEVALDLPDKERIFHYVTLEKEQRDVYDALREKLFMWLDEEEKDFISITNLLAQLTRLRQVAAYPAGVKVEIKDEDGNVIAEKAIEVQESAKIDAAMEIIDELLQNGEKVLVFSTFNDPLLRVEELLAGKTYPQVNGEGVTERPVAVGRIVGGIDERKRAITVDRFNDPLDDLRVVVGNTRAMGLGYNLQGACSTAVFLDLWWSPGVNEQAEDRLHRGGQKNNVMIHVIQAEDTVDGFIMAKLEAKLDMASGVIERAELRRFLDEGLI